MERALPKSGQAGKSSNTRRKLWNSSPGAVAAAAVAKPNQARHFNTSKDACLADILNAELEKVAPTQESVACADRCLEELNEVVRQLGPEWDVQPFGSFANGFATVSSDLDVTCHQRGHLVGSDAQAYSASALGAIAQVLESRPSFTIEEQILGARIPILKLRFANALDIDLSCHNPIPILNTRLLRAYSKIDSRIRDLGVAIKLWSKRVGVCDATKSNLSSYSFTLLVIYFLQVHKEVRLPVLPVEAFADDAKQEADERVLSALSTWRCDLNLVDLMTRFFAFYCNFDSQGFRWGEEVVSVRCGGQHLVFESIFSRLRGRHVHRLHIEDPYQLERNLHGVLGEVEETQLRSAFWVALQDLQQLRMPHNFVASQEPLLKFSAADEVGVGMEDLLQHYKSMTAAESTAESTESGGTAPETGSDSESCDDRTGSGIVSSIPWPKKLCPLLRKQSYAGPREESPNQCTKLVFGAAPSAATSQYAKPQSLQYAYTNWVDCAVPESADGYVHMLPIFTGDEITERL